MSRINPKRKWTLSSKYDIRALRMQDEVSAEKLKAAVGKRVQVLAFGVAYEGVLTKVDARSGLVRVEDEKDYVLLEIERIEHFRVFPR